MIVEERVAVVEAQELRRGRVERDAKRRPEEIGDVRHVDDDLKRVSRGRTGGHADRVGAGSAVGRRERRSELAAATAPGDVSATAAAGRQRRSRKQNQETKCNVGSVHGFLF